MYKYDIFVSYKRDEHWLTWYHERFVRQVKKYLPYYTAKEASIFIDRQIQPGETWPRTLGEAIAKSRIILPCFNSLYFESHWCELELDIMLARYRKNIHSRIICPLVVHDCESLPGHVSSLQVDRLDTRFFNSEMIQEGKLHEDFSAFIREFCPKLATAITSAPSFDPNWEDECIKRFERLYQSHLNGEPSERANQNNSSRKLGLRFFPSVRMQ